MVDDCVNTETTVVVTVAASDGDDDAELDPDAALVVDSTEEAPLETEAPGAAVDEDDMAKVGCSGERGRVWRRTGRGWDYGDAGRVISEQGVKLGWDRMEQIAQRPPARQLVEWQDRPA